MDKYEFNLKVEQLNKLVKSGDYKAAMRITDTIDWRRVHKADLLATVSEVYEKNNEYKEARGRYFRGTGILQGVYGDITSRQ